MRFVRCNHVGLPRREIATYVETRVPEAEEPVVGGALGAEEAEWADEEEVILVRRPEPSEE